MYRISIRTLMAFVVVSAVGLAALRAASDLWAGLLLLVALAAVGVAILGAAFMGGAERAWWAGFALFGGGYLALAVGPCLSDTYQSSLGTTHLLNHIHGRMHASVIQPQVDLMALKVRREKAVVALTKLRGLVRHESDPALSATRTRLEAIDQEIAAIKNVASIDQFNFSISMSIILLLAGLIGGTIATWFRGRRKLADMDRGSVSIEQPKEYMQQATSLC